MLNLETGIEVAEKAISDGGERLDRLLSKIPLDSVQLQAENSFIQMGIQRKRKLDGYLLILKERKRKLTKKNT